MLILGLETSGQRSSVALLQDQTVLQSCSLMEQGRPQTQRLVIAVRDLCRAAGRTPADIDLLAISQGPGSFTGLRIGLVFAKTWAYTMGCALKGVSTFAATVELLPATYQTIEVVEDLRKGQVAWQRFTHRAAGWQPVGPLQTDDFDDWRQADKTGIFLTGSGLSRLEKQLPDRRFPADWQILPETERFPDAAAVAQLGRKEFLLHKGDDPFSLQPIYVRRSAAEERLK